MSYTLYKTDRGYYYSDLTEVQGCIEFINENDRFIDSIHSIINYVSIITSDDLKFISSKCLMLNILNEEYETLTKQANQLSKKIREVETLKNN